MTTSNTHDDEAAAEAYHASMRAADNYTRCRDCGVFVSKNRWVKKDPHNAPHLSRRPLCANCLAEYDTYY